MHTISRTFALLIGCVLLSLCSFGQQTSYLEKKVTIRQSTLSYAELFRQLSQQTEVVFSYTRFDDSRKITVRYEQKQLRLVLNELFNDGSCSYKLRGRYIILSCKTTEKPKAESNTDVVVNGYIYSADDSSLVAQSSVYVRQSRQSAVTNDNGYFSMSVPKNSDVLSISVAKENYEDTTVVILSRQRNTIVIYLQPKAQEVTITIDDTIKVAFTPDTNLAPLQTLPPANDFWARFRSERTNLRNIADTLFTNVSVSFVPPLSTNRLLALNTVNRVSFNILVGYSHGVDAFELGGLLNLDYGNVRYFQLGGLANLVSGNVAGIQVGGLLNTVGGSMEGTQIGGLFNVVRGKMRYLQVGGLGNVVGDSVFGIQVGGLVNINAQHTDGFQLAGIYNNARSFNGMQLAGIANTTWKPSKGIQFAGIANTADTLYGPQIAGIMNSANYIYGFQLGGLVNRAREIHGSQLGFINVAHTITGVPFGFFSYVHTGYHKIELATDENLFGTVSFRTGINGLHNIFIGGIQLSGDKKNPLWTYGYGLGTSIRLTDKWYIGADLTGQQLQLANSYISHNLLGKAFLGVEYRMAKRFNVVAGPTLNWFNAQNDEPDSEIIWDRIGQRTILDDDNGFFVNRLWIGAKVAIRFL